MDQGMQAASRRREKAPPKKKKWTYLREPPQIPVKTLMSAQRDPFWTSDLHNYNEFESF